VFSALQPNDVSSPPAAFQGANPSVSNDAVHLLGSKARGAGVQGAGGGREKESMVLQFGAGGAFQELLFSFILDVAQKIVASAETSENSCVVVLRVHLQDVVR
jgi:hypothetical protein